MSPLRIGDQTLTCDVVQAVIGQSFLPFSHRLARFGLNLSPHIQGIGSQNRNINTYFNILFFLIAKCIVSLANGVQLRLK